MWFKQIQLFSLLDSVHLTAEKLIEMLEPFAFTSCLPSFATSSGWTSPFEDDGAPLAHSLNGNIIFCLMIEDKILPASVVKQELTEKIKMLETNFDRKLRQKEKLALKDEVIMTLLPRAFSKLTRIYAYIDTKNNWLVLNSVHGGKTEQFTTMFKKAVTENIKSIETQKIAPLLTHWVKTQKYPNQFSIENACLLQDPERQNRMIRCQNQDLFASSILSLIKDGCEVKQLALKWQDRLDFVLADDFSIRSIKYEDEILQQVKEIDAETKQQQFDADFFIMTETLSHFLKDLLIAFARENEPQDRELEKQIA